MDHVLYFVGAPPSHDGPESRRVTEAALDAAARRVSPVRSQSIRVAFETSVVRCLARLRSGGADARVVDARGELGPFEESPSLALLRALFDEHAIASPIGRERTWVVVDGCERGAALAFEAGRGRLAGVVAGPADRSSAGEATWEHIWEKLVATLSRGRGGKIALCLAGGGTEGLFYEFGVLRALGHFLPHWRLTEVDVLCGISAGAVVAALLANGIGPEEIAAGLRGERATRVDPIRRSDLFDPNLSGLAKRAASLSWEVVRGRRAPLSALFRLPPAGMFAGARLKKWLERQLTKPGMKNDFDELDCKLFIGATDQDTNAHVLFGSKDAPRVPIHIAVRASAALTPFYAPEKIDGRYYVDGGFTRTTNMRVAVQEGATLVILVDPLVPITSPRPGYVADRGGVFVAMQGLKSLINGRFDKAVPTLKAMYPHVAFHLFQPGEAARRVMAGSPMKYFYREEIEEIAYRETVREIRTWRSRELSRDFARHGVEFADPDFRPPGDDRADADDVRVVA